MIKRLISLKKRKDLTAEEKTETRYAIVHNGNNIFYAIELTPELQISTGLSHLEVFDTKQAAYDLFVDKIKFNSDRIEPLI